MKLPDTWQERPANVPADGVCRAEEMKKSVLVGSDNVPVSGRIKIDLNPESCLSLCRGWAAPSSRPGWQVSRRWLF